MELPADGQPFAPAVARTGGSDDTFDPWVEVEAAAFQHNVREVARLAGGRPIMAVVKNNAYGLGESVVGPLLAKFKEVTAIACVRVAEAVTLREAGVTKPILIMAEATDRDALELAAHKVWLSPWLERSGRQLDRLAERFGRPIPVHPYIDTGLGRDGVPYYRALPWIEDLAKRKSVRIEGTYSMFSHDLEFDREQLDRFVQLTTEVRSKGIHLGRLHMSPTLELFLMPEGRLEMVRVGNALFGNYVSEKAMGLADLKTVFRLRARVVRVVQLRPGDSANYHRGYIATRPTWVATLPIGHTDGYPAEASGTCQVFINGRLYPVIGEVSAGHTIVEVGTEKTVEVGDIGTFIGPDDPEIEPLAVSTKTKVPFFRLITKLNGMLPKRVV
jgi:alanine racemase